MTILMIPNRDKCEATSGGRWHYLAVKKLSVLLRGDWEVLSKLSSFFRIKNKLGSHKRVFDAIM